MSSLILPNIGLFNINGYNPINNDTKTRIINSISKSKKINVWVIPESHLPLSLLSALNDTLFNYKWFMSPCIGKRSRGVIIGFDRDHTDFKVEISDKKGRWLSVSSKWKSMKYCISGVYCPEEMEIDTLQNLASKLDALNLNNVPNIISGDFNLNSIEN
jgi:hypothetical protein